MGVEKRADGWYARVKRPGRGWVYEKLKGVRTKAEALEEFYELARQASRVERGLEPLSVNPKKWTFSRGVLWWLSSFSKDDRETYSMTKHLVNGSLGNMLLEQVTPGEISRFLREIPKVSKTTRANIRRDISRVFGRLIEEEIFLGSNPVARTKTPKQTMPDPVFLERGEVDALLGYLDGVIADDEETDRARKAARAWRLIYTLALYTGMRRGEIWALRWSDVDLDRSTITVRRSNAKATTKGGRARVIDIAPEMLPYLRAAKDAAKTTLVCPGADGEQRSEDAKSSDQLAEHLTLAGVKRDIRFHDLRDTFASWFLMNGGDIVSLQEYLGHASIETTRRRYGHISREHKRGQMARFSLRGPGSTDVANLAGTIGQAGETRATNQTVLTSSPGRRGTGGNRGN